MSSLQLDTTTSYTFRIPQDPFYSIVYVASAQ